MLRKYRTEIRIVVTSLVLVCFTVTAIIGWNKGWFDEWVKNIQKQEVQAATSPLSVIEFNQDTNPEEFYLPKYQQSDNDYQGVFVTESEVIKQVWVEWILTEDENNLYYYNRSKNGIEKITISKKGKNFEVWEAKHKEQEGINIKQDYELIAKSEPFFEIASVITDQPSVIPAQAEIQKLENNKILNQVQHDNKWKDLKISKIHNIKIQNKNIVQQIELKDILNNQYYILDTTFNLSSKKWTWSVANPNGDIIRGYWQTEINENIIDSDPTYIKSNNFIIDWGDFLKNEFVSQESEGNIHKVYFYPEGTMDNLVIDPYVSTSNESTYYVVKGNYYHFKIYKTSSDGFLHFSDTADNDMGRWEDKGPSFTSGGTDYYSHYDDTRVVNVKESTPTRVVMYATGGFDDTYGSSGTYLTDTSSNKVTYELYIYAYSDYIIYRLIVHAGDGFYEPSQDGNTSLVGFRYDNYNYDSATVYYGDELNEGTASNYSWYENVDYTYVFGTSTNPIIPDVQTIILSNITHATSTNVMNSYWETGSGILSTNFKWHNGQVIGDSEMVVRMNFYNETLTEASQRRAKVIEARNQDIPGMTFGSNDMMSDGEITQSANADGSYHVGTNDFGYDLNDNDVLFYSNLGSVTDNQLPQKGSGTLDVTGSLSLASGKVGDGMSNWRDGNDNRFIATSTANVSGTKGRIGTWFKMDREASALTGNVFIFRIPASESFDCQIIQTIDGFYCRYGGQTIQYNNITHNAGEWHFFEYIYDSDADYHEIRVDGELLDRDDESLSAVTLTDNIYIGSHESWNSTSYGFPGVLDEFYISKDPDQPYVRNESKFNMHVGNNAIAAASSTVTFVGGSDIQLYYDENATTTPSFVDPNGAYTAWATISDRIDYGAYNINDPNVTFYWDMNSTTTIQYPQKGSGVIRVEGTPSPINGVANNGIGNWDDNYQNRAAASTTDNLVADKGKIGFWAKLNTLPADLSDSEILFNVPNSSGNFYCAFNSVNDNLRCEYNGNSLLNTSVIWDTGHWYWLEFAWDADNDIYRVYRDGQLLIYDTDAASVLTLGENLIIGNNSYGLNDGFSGIIDEFYISKNPDQKNTPSFYDVFSYTDLHNSYFSGIPDSGVGSIKWNYVTSSTVPIITQAKRVNPSVTVHNWYPRTELTPSLDLPLDGQGGTGSQVYNATSSSWLGTVSSGVSFTSGKDDNGAVFDNDADYIDINEAKAFSTYDKGTVEFWYKPSYDFTTGMDSDILSSDNSSNQNELYIYTTASLFYCSMRDNGWNTRAAYYDYYTVGQLWSADEWVKIKCTWDSTSSGENIRLYVNDQEYTYSAQQSGGYIMGAPSASRTVTIGNNTSVDRTHHASGVIDNVRIYSEAIDGEIRDSGNYPSGKSYTNDSTILDLSFDHPTSTPSHVFDRHEKGYVTASTLSSGVEFKAGHTGLGAAFEDDDDYLTLTQSAAGIATSTTIGFWYKNTTTTFDNLYYAHAFSMDSTEGSASFLRLHDPDECRLVINGTTLIDETSAFPPLENTGWHYIMTGWDADLGEAFIQVDDTRVTTSTTFYVPSYSGDFYIGNRSYIGQTREVQGIMDDFIILDGYYRPYGSWPESSLYGKDDHSALRFFWGMEDANNAYASYVTGDSITGTIQTTPVFNTTSTLGDYGLEINSSGDAYNFTVTSDDIGNLTEGRIGAWIYITETIPSGTRPVFRLYGNADNYVRGYIDGDDVQCRVRIAGVDAYATVGSVYNEIYGIGWHFVEFAWGNGIIKTYIDGSDAAANTYSGTWGASAATLNIGDNAYDYTDDYWLDNIYILDKSNLISYPTMDYQYILVPGLALGTEGSLVEKTMGDEYDVTALNSLTSYLITYNNVLQSDTMWLAKEDFTSSDLSGRFDAIGPTRLKSGIKLKKGIRIK